MSYLLEERAVFRELLDDVFCEEGLDDDLDRLVLLIDAQLLDLLEHLDRSGLGAVLLEPDAERTVWAACTLAVIVVVVTSADNKRLHATLECLHASGNSLGRRVGLECVVAVCVAERGCLLRDALRQLVIRAVATISRASRRVNLSWGRRRWSSQRYCRDPSWKPSWVGS